jgi:hypothetical protein
MLKKLCASLLALLILTTFSISAYAGKFDGGFTTQPFSSGAPLPVPTGSPVKGTVPSKGAIETANISKSAVEVTNASKSAIEAANASKSAIAITNASESAITTESTYTTDSAITDKTVKKPVFEEVFNDVLKEGTAIKNDYFIMTITNPQMDKESTVYKSYILSGNSKYDDVIISIAKYNEDTGKYEPMTNTDGESSWAIGEYRLFSKEIQLTEGTNKIKMIAYRTSQKEEALKENIQVNCFTISLLKEDLFTKTVNTFKQAVDSLSGFKKTGK